MNNFVVYGVLGMSLVVNAYQVYKIDKYKSVADILDQKDRFTQSGYSELLYSHISSLRNDQAEAAKSQGKIEGILSVVNNAKPEENEISSIWHSGYYRGMDQVEYVRTMAYEDGYHRACDDMGCPAAAAEKYFQNTKKPVSIPAEDKDVQPSKNPTKPSQIDPKQPQVQPKPTGENK